ncbi:MAG TPA: hypothetical protein PLE00_08805 [Anaerolineaceae bacterium]|jgi:hypothetical protein|nr:hypothetical protein [Anaerolineaceae bacterium]
MSDTINSEKELGNALKDEKDTIIIEGDLVKKVVRIRATGKVAWAIAAGAIAVAIIIVIRTGGTGTPGAALIGGAAVGILGLPAALAAISIGVAAGGVAALNKLRQYKEAERSAGRLVLKRK